MFGQDLMLVGQQVFDLPPKPAPRLQYYSWEWRQVGMLGQDHLPSGKQIYDLTVAQTTPKPIEQTWVWNQTRMIGRDVLPTGDQIYDLAYQTRYPRPDETWVWNQIPMTGMDRLPVGEQIFDLTPKAPPPAGPTWAWSQVIMIGQDKLVAGQQAYDLPVKPPAPIQETWVWRQVQMLGQDRLPAGQQVYDLAQKLAAPRSPYYGTEWSQVRMFGQDQLLVGQQATDLPPRDFQRLFQTWIQSVNVALVTTAEALEVTVHRIENVLPTQPFRPEQTWTWRQVDKIGQDAMLVGQQVYDRPVLTPQRVVDWIQSTNVNLAAVQVIPFGAVTELPRQPARIEQTTTWNQTRMLGQDRMLVGKQIFDLPVRGPAPIDQTTAWSQTRMIGQDLLPVGQAIFDLPRQPIRLEQPWSFGRNLALNFVPGPLGVVANQYDWPLPIPRALAPPDTGRNFTIYIPATPVTGIIPLRTLMGTGL